MGYELIVETGRGDPKARYSPLHAATRSRRLADLSPSRSRGVRVQELHSLYFAHL